MASPCRSTKLREPVRKLVIPILKAHADVMYPLVDGTFGYREGSEADERFQQLYYGVLELKTRASDEALAALLWFYLGDHPHEELICEIRSRGQHMLPILAKYSLCKPETPGVTLPAQSVWASVEVDELVADIKNGETCRSDDD